MTIYNNSNCKLFRYHKIWISLQDSSVVQGVNVNHWSYQYSNNNNHWINIKYKLPEAEGRDGKVCMRTTSLRFDLVPLFITKLVRFKRPADLDNPRCNCTALIWGASEAMTAVVKLEDRPVRAVPVGAINPMGKWAESCTSGGSGVREMVTPLMNNVGDRGIPCYVSSEANL